MQSGVFVSGSSRGIGRAVSFELARRGFAVAVNGRTMSPALTETCDKITALGGRAVAVIGDVSDPANAVRLLDQAEAGIGPLCALVCNAGVGPMKRADILEVTPESMAHCLGNNTVGPFFLLQDFARRMVSNRAPEGIHRSAVIISSANAEAASLSKADYCISKAGVAMVAKLFGMRLGHCGVQVVDVRPGVIETDLSAVVIADYARRIQDDGLALVPRVGQPQDVAMAVAAIVSGQLPYVQGTVLAVDGGLSVERF